MTENKDLQAGRPDYDDFHGMMLARLDGKTWREIGEMFGRTPESVNESVKKYVGKVKEASDRGVVFDPHVITFTKGEKNLVLECSMHGVFHDEPKPANHVGCNNVIWAQSSKHYKEFHKDSKGPIGT